MLGTQELIIAGVVLVVLVFAPLLFAFARAGFRRPLLMAIPVSIAVFLVAALFAGYTGLNALAILAIIAIAAVVYGFSRPVITASDKKCEETLTTASSAGSKQTETPKKLSPDKVEQNPEWNEFTKRYRTEELSKSPSLPNSSQLQQDAPAVVSKSETKEATKDHVSPSAPNALGTPQNKTDGYDAKPVSYNPESVASDTEPSKHPSESYKAYTKQLASQFLVFLAIIGIPILLIVLTSSPLENFEMLPIAFIMGGLLILLFWDLFVAQLSNAPAQPKSNSDSNSSDAELESLKKKNEELKRKIEAKKLAEKRANDIAALEAENARLIKELGEET